MIESQRNVSLFEVPEDGVGSMDFEIVVALPGGVAHTLNPHLFLHTIPAGRVVVRVTSRIAVSKPPEPVTPTLYEELHGILQSEGLTNAVMEIFDRKCGNTEWSA